MELAKRYMRARHLPPPNLLLLSFNDPVNINTGDFDRKLLTPVMQRISRCGDAIDYVVLVRGVPYRLNRTSTTAAILYGGTDNIRSTNGYFGNALPFEASIPYGGDFLVPATTISAFNFNDGARLIDSSVCHYRDVPSAGTFYFCEGRGARGTRNRQIQQAIAIMEANGLPCERISHPQVKNKHDVLGQFTGSTHLDLASNTYLPGSILDNLTSHGGYLLDPGGQVTLLSFVRYGVCGAYGTVVEPTNTPARWANYTLPIRYAGGFSLMESYLQTISDWTMGLVLGDPLMSPFGNPCKVHNNPAANRFRDSDEIRVDIDVEEGKSNYGIAWVEVWLNEQDLLLHREPLVPQGVQWNLSVTKGSDSVFSHTYRSTDNEPLTRILNYFTYCGNSSVSIHQVGKRKNKLLIRWHPPLEESFGDIPNCNLIALDGNTPFPLSKPLQFRPYRAECAIYDFGKIPPLTGDELRIGVEGSTISMTAYGNETVEDFLQRTADKIGEQNPFGKREEWKVQVRPNPAQPEESQLWFVPSYATMRRRLDLTVHVVRAPKSQFAGELAVGAPSWKSVQVGRIAETVMQPTWKNPKVNESILVPRTLVCAGFNVLRTRAGTFLGEETETVSEIYVDNPELNGSIKVDTDRLSLGDDLVVYMQRGIELFNSYAVLYIDGFPVASGTPETAHFETKVELPHLCPGSHRLWVEWTTEPFDMSIFKKRYPVSRSKPITIFIRRPLQNTTRFTPRDVMVGPKAAIELTGPYLHSGLEIVINGSRIPITQTDKGFNWTVDISGLDVGTYSISIVGDADTEEIGRLSEKLEVLPRFYP